jgi:arsenate reductase-like glutaredoxin family protein
MQASGFPPPKDLTMELNEGNIHVGQYLTNMPSKEILEKKLSQAISNAREMLSQRGYKESKLEDYTGRNENEQ